MTDTTPIALAILDASVFYLLRQFPVKEIAKCPGRVPVISNNFDVMGTGHRVVLLVKETSRSPSRVRAQ